MAQFVCLYLARSLGHDILPELKSINTNADYDVRRESGSVGVQTSTCCAIAQKAMGTHVGTSMRKDWNMSAISMQERRGCIDPSHEG